MISKVFFVLMVLASLSETEVLGQSVFSKSKNHLKTKGLEGLVLVRAECLADSKKSESMLPLWVKRLWLKSGQILPPGMTARSLSFPLASVNERDLKHAEQSPCILGIDHNEIIETSAAKMFSDTLYGKQLYLPFIHFEKQELLFRSPLFKDFSPVTVAVVDSGISLSHPEFIGRFWSDCAGHAGFNFILGNYEIEDDSGHGSHVAGLIAARSNNGQGIVGISQNSRLMILKTQDSSGQGSVGDVADAIRFAADQGADVINLSLAISSNPASIQDAVDYALQKGAFIVVASGNSGIEITDTQFISPAGLAADRAGMISVGSVDSESGLLSEFSNHSSYFVEVAAPGSHGMDHILSTYKNGRYFSMIGTSMSTPLVAGAVAEMIGFLRSENKEISPQDFESFILDHSSTNEQLTSVIHQGKQLDLEMLGRAALKNFKLSADGGLDE